MFLFTIVNGIIPFESFTPIWRLKNTYDNCYRSYLSFWTPIHTLVVHEKTITRTISLAKQRQQIQQSNIH